MRRRLRRHFERTEAGAPSGSIRLANIAPHEYAALASLMGRPPRQANSIEVPMARIDAMLGRVGIAPTLRAALEALDGPIVHLPTQRAEASARWAEIARSPRHPGLARLIAQRIAERVRPFRALGPCPVPRFGRDATAGRAGRLLRSVAQATCSSGAAHAGDRHLFDRKMLRRMKPTAILMNTAGGPIVDDAALHQALAEGWIAGAALDDIEKEPAKLRDWRQVNPFFWLENVIITPARRILFGGVDRHRGPDRSRGAVRVSRGLPSPLAGA